MCVIFDKFNDKYKRILNLDLLLKNPYPRVYVYFFFFQFHSTTRLHPQNYKSEHEGPKKELASSNAPLRSKNVKA